MQSRRSGEWQTWLGAAVGTIVVCAALTGCTNGRPRLYGPGTIPQQQYQATMFDPYTDNDVAPPVVGGRPRDYQNPLPEPVRNTWFFDSWWGR